MGTVAQGPGKYVVLRVRPEYRRGCGKYWRQFGAGYTDEIDEAGLWPTTAVPRTDRADAVPIYSAMHDEINEGS